MAYTEVSHFLVGRGTSPPETEVTVSVLTAGAAENVAHYGPSGVAPHSVTWEVLTRPTDGSDVRVWHDHDNDNTTNDTARLVFSCEAGGSLTGAVVRLHFTFNAMKSGGITPP